MKKKKIFFILPSLAAGGAERVISTLANIFSAKYDIYIITLNKSEIFYVLNSDVHTLYCIENIIPSKNIFDAIKLNYLLLKKILFYLKQEKPDIVISFMTSSNILAIIATMIKNIPCIISERNFPITNRIPKIRRYLRKWLYKKADFLVVQTEEIKDFFSSIIDEEKIIILPNPIAKELAKSRNLNSIKENIILNVGSLTNQKAQDVLIKAFANIDNDNWKLLIIGEGEKRIEYEALIRSLNIQNKVILLGLTKDISLYYNSATIFAFTSLFEGFPNALTEAMYFGLPCISTDCPTGPSKLIRNGENGFLIPIGDQQKLENCLSKLISDKNLQKTFRENAITTTKQFDADTIILQWDSLINHLI